MLADGVLIKRPNWLTNIYHQIELGQARSIRSLVYMSNLCSLGTYINQISKISINIRFKVQARPIKMRYYNNHHVLQFSLGFPFASLESLAHCVFSAGTSALTREFIQVSSSPFVLTVALPIKTG